MKIFGIGLSKTGTTSLASALELLGYRTKDYPGLEVYQPDDLGTLDARLLSSYDAFTDTPIPSLYRALDRAFPGSKFILTVRDMEGWLKSCRKQFTQKLADKQNEAHNRLFIDLYGTPVFDEALFRAGYERFVRGVMDYFKDRPQDLLVLNVTAGEGWEKLCPFLGKPIPDLPFPKANVTSIQWMDLQALVNVAMTAGEAIRCAHLAIKPDMGGQLTWQERLRASFVRAKHALHRDRRAAALHDASEDCSTRIAQGLARLSPGIPLVNRTTVATLRQDSNWNHFWLVDPLDGEAGFGTDLGDFSVDIALIQDRKPIAGVVYAPLSGLVYVGMQGKGAYKQSCDGTRIQLPMPSAVPAETQPPSTALALCERLGRKQPPPLELTSSWEWQTAAAQAILQAAGHRLQECDTGQEVAYNKPGWKNLCVRLA
jgi:3'-phosphoadenosine 5'-phosphosulfate (PAPS) 3'-phosphatase